MRRFTPRFDVPYRLAISSLAAVALGLMLGAMGLRTASAQAVADDVDYDWLHRQWARFLPPGTECTWPTYYVDERAGRGGDGSVEQPFAALAEALAAAGDTAVCGPTVILRSGRYKIGRLVLSKPTILRGQAGTTIVGSIVNVSALPLWVEELTVAEASFPGAVVAAHPDAETTLARVAITAATGIGAFQHGGRLEMRDSLIERSVAGDQTDAAQEIGRLASLLPRTGPYVPSHLARLQEVVQTLPDGVLGPILPIDFVVKDFAVHLAALLACAGTGLYVSGGAYVNLTGTANLFNGNDRAGMVATDAGTFVEGQNVWAQLNGAGPPPPHDNVPALLESGYCMAGIQVGQEAFVNLTDVQANGNNYFGVIIHHGGMSFFNGLYAAGNADLFNIGTGDGMVGFAGSLAAQNFGSFLNKRIGILVQSALVFVEQNGTWIQTSKPAQFFLFNGLSSQNRFGIVTEDCDIVNYLAQHNVTVSGNTEQNILLNGPCPLPIPPPPPVPKE